MTIVLNLVCDHDDAAGVLNSPPNRDSQDTSDHSRLLLALLGGVAPCLLIFLAGLGRPPFVSKQEAHLPRPPAWPNRQWISKARRRMVEPVGSTAQSWISRFAASSGVMAEVIFILRSFLVTIVHGG